MRAAVQKYGERVAVSIDTRNGKVAADGWTETSEVDYLDMAAEMEKAGVRNIIFTDISRDGTMTGPNLDMLDRLNYSFSFHIIASGGVSSLKDIINLTNLNLHGAICGKALYSGALDLKSAIMIAGLVEASVARKEKTPTLGAFPEKWFDPGNYSGGRDKRGAYVGVYEPGIAQADPGNRAHLVLQPEPA